MGSRKVTLASYTYCLIRVGTVLLISLLIKFKVSG